MAAKYINLKLNKSQLGRLKSFVTSQLERLQNPESGFSDRAHYMCFKEINECIQETTQVKEEHSSLTKLELLSVIRGLQKKNEELQVALKNKGKFKLTLYEVYKKLVDVKHEVSPSKKFEIIQICKDSLVGKHKKHGGNLSKRTKNNEMKRLNRKLEGLPRRWKPDMKNNKINV